MNREHNIIESWMKFIIKHAKLVILVLLIITAFFAYHMKDIRIDANVLKEVSIEQNSAVEASKKQVEVIQKMMAGYQNMANSIQSQSDNLNCQIESLVCKMQQFQVKTR